MFGSTYKDNVNNTASTGTWNQNTTTASTKTGDLLTVDNQSGDGSKQRSNSALFYLTTDDAKGQKEDGMIIADSNITDREVDIVKKEIEVKKHNANELNHKYAQVVLWMIFLVQVANQWQRAFVSCVYNFTYDGAQTNPYYNIQADIPNFSETMYALLAGPAFMFLFGTLSLFSGMISDIYNRRNILCFSCIIWSLCSMGSGWCQSFMVLFTLRIILDVCQANVAPNAYGLISDYFPPETRTSANALYALGIYLGAGLTNFSILLIDNFGWRMSYVIVGAIGLGSGILAQIVIKEPPRNRFAVTKKKEDAQPAEPARSVSVAEEAAVKAVVQDLNIKAEENAENSTKIDDNTMPSENRNLSYLSGTQQENDFNMGKANVNRTATTGDAEQSLLGDSTVTLPLQDDNTNQSAATDASEPKKKKKEKEPLVKFYLRGLKNILGNEASRWSTLGGCARFWQNQIVVYFSLTYFAYFDQNNIFGLVNGWAIIIGGAVSNMVGGYLADKYEPKSFRTKPMICIFMSAASIPCLMGAFLTSFNFWFSLFWLALENFTSEGFTPINIAILQTVVDPEFKGMATGMFRALQTYAFAFGFLIVGKLTANMDNQQDIGYAIGISCIIPSFFAIYCYWKSMSFYVAIKEQQKAEKERAMSKTEAYVPAPKEATLLQPRRPSQNGESGPTRSRSINIEDLSFGRAQTNYKANVAAIEADATNANGPIDEEEEYKYEENLTRFGIVNRSSYASSRFSASVHLSDTMTSQDLYSFLKEDQQKDENEDTNRITVEQV